MRVSASVSNAFKVPPVMLTAKFVALMFASEFNVKVEEVRTATFEGKLRRRGRFAGYRSDWKKAYVKLVAGQKVPEFTEM